MAFPPSVTSTRRCAKSDQALRQIGRALHEVGEDAAGFGIEIRVEVHSEITQEPKNFSRILERRFPRKEIRQSSYGCLRHLFRRM